MAALAITADRVGPAGGLGKPRCECWNLFLQIPVERLEGLLLWRDPYASAKVFGAGLYMLICLRHLVCGELSQDPGRTQLPSQGHQEHHARLPGAAP